MFVRLLCGSLGVYLFNPSPQMDFHSLNEVFPKCLALFWIPLLLAARGSLAYLHMHTWWANDVPQGVAFPLRPRCWRLADHTGLYKWELSRAHSSYNNTCTHTQAHTRSALILLPQQFGWQLGLFAEKRTTFFVHASRFVCHFGLLIFMEFPPPLAQDRFIKVDPL